MDKKVSAANKKLAKLELNAKKAAETVDQLTGVNKQLTERNSQLVEKFTQEIAKISSKELSPTDGLNLALKAQVIFCVYTYHF